MITEETAAKIVYRLMALVAGFVLVFALGWAWEWGLFPRKAVSEGSIQMRDGNTLKTREYLPPARVEYSGGVPRVPLAQPGPRQEIQLPSGRWIDCQPDCLAAYERAME